MPKNSFLGDGFDHSLLYNVMNYHPKFYRNMVKQLRKKKEKAKRKRKHIFI